MSAMAFSEIDRLTINTIRTLSIDAIQKATCGHPGLPMGAAPMAYVLWQKHLKFNPKNPEWFDRDRFVLSAGHGSMLLYSLLHLYGYDVTLEDIKNFRQLGSKTPGHPESFMTPGVEATTGPLGQGTANAVGMALAERKLANLLNQNSTLVDHTTYAIVSDGDLMEGVSAEAASFAGHLKLGKLIYLYDSNDITLDGPADLCFSTENVAKRYEAYGWHVIQVKDGNHDLEAIDAAIIASKKETTKPSLIIVKTTIGYGSPNKAGKSSSHGSALGTEEVALTKKALNWPYTEAFTIPAEVLSHCALAAKRGADAEIKWNETLAETQKNNPAAFALYQNCLDQKLDFSAVTNFNPGEDFATRETSGKVLNAIAKTNPWFLGGDADLSCSTNTAIKDAGSFHGQTGAGKNIHYGVREHAMASIASGIAYHGGLRSYTATFFCFADYMRPAFRLAAMNKLPVIYIFTHDSIGVGEDGPTHQPIEHLMSLRVIPNLITLRPADANETKEAWVHAMKRTNGPTALVLSRQKLKTLDRTNFASADGLHQGAYILSDKPGYKAIIVATGSEVHTALEAQSLLDIPVRVVSMPSVELFLAQPKNYRETILPAASKKISIEAGVTLGWREIVGDQGLAIGIDEYGASAPASKLFELYKIDSQSVTKRIKQWLQN